MCRRQDGAQHVGRPVDAQGVDAEDDEVRAVHGFVQAVVGVGDDGRRKREVEFGMPAGFVDFLDDVAVQVGADEADLVAVVREGCAECAAHEACAEDDDMCHAMPSGWYWCWSRFVMVDADLG